MNINCYGLKKVTFTLDQNTDKTQFTERMLLQKAESIPLSEFKQPSPRVKVFTYSTPKPQDGYYFTYIVNQDEKYTYNEECNYSAFEGCTLIDNHQGNDNCFIEPATYKMQVGPGQAKLVIVEVAASGYSMASSKQASFL